MLILCDFRGTQRKHVHEIMSFWRMYHQMVFDTMKSRLHKRVCCSFPHIRIPPFPAMSLRAMYCTYIYSCMYIQRNVLFSKRLQLPSSTNKEGECGFMIW
jgi:hypothetical protein